MTQVSHNPLHKDVFFDIRDELLWVFSELRGRVEVKSFYDDFFTKTEQVMFAKRLAIAILLVKDFHYRDVCRILHVSTSTVTKISGQLDYGAGGIKHAVAKLLHEERMEKFWAKVNKIIDRNLMRPHLYPRG